MVRLSAKDDIGGIKVGVDYATVMGLLLSIGTPNPHALVRSRSIPPFDGLPCCRSNSAPSLSRWIRVILELNRVRTDKPVDRSSDKTAYGAQKRG